MQDQPRHGMPALIQLRVTARHLDRVGLFRFGPFWLSLVWLGLAWLGLGAPARGAQLETQEGSAVAETVDLSKARFDRIQALLAQEQSFEEGRLELHLFTQDILGQPIVDQSKLYYCVRQLTRDERLTPDPLERAEYFTHGAEAAKALGYQDPWLSMLEGRAKALSEAGRRTQACEELQEALDQVQELTLRLPHSFVLLAELWRGDGNFAAALDCADIAIDFCGDDPAHVDGLVKAIQAKASAHSDIGNPDLGEAEIRGWMEQLSSWEGVEAAQLNPLIEELFRLYLHQGNMARVRDEAGRWLDSSFTENNPRGRALLSMWLGTAWIEKERYLEQDYDFKGRAYLEEALASADLKDNDRFFIRVKLAEEALNLTDLERAATHLEELRKFNWKAIDLVLRCEGVLVEARFVLADDSGQDLLNSTRDKLLQTLDELEQAWKRTPEVQGGVGFLKYSQRRGVVDVLLRVEMALEPGPTGVERSFAHLLGLQENSSLARLLPGSKALTLEDVRSDLLVSEDHGLLLLFTARDRSHAFAVDRSGISHHPIARSSVVSEARRAYVSCLQTRGVPNLTQLQQGKLAARERRLAGELAEALFDDELLARMGSWQRLSVSGMDTTLLIPFAWLPFGEEPHLGTEMAIDYVPSIPFALRSLRKRAGKSYPQSLFLLSDANPSEDLLPEHPELVSVGLGAQLTADLKTLYGHNFTDFLRGQYATGAALADRQLSDFSVAQFFVHAIEDTQAAAPVSLVLSPDERSTQGLLTVPDIGELEGAAALTVLTACGSGQGPVRKGDPLVASPIGAWLALGSKAVIAAHLQLTVEEARRTTRILHEQLGSGGCSPAEAMRQVRLDLVEDQPELAPFLHGLQQVVGAGHQAVFETPRPGNRPKRDKWRGNLLVPLLVVGLLLAVRALRKRTRTEAT